MSQPWTANEAQEMADFYVVQDGLRPELRGRGEHERAVRSERLESERGWIAGPMRSRADRSWRLQEMPQNGRNEHDELLGKCEGDVGAAGCGEADCQLGLSRLAYGAPWPLPR